MYFSIALERDMQGVFFLTESAGAGNSILMSCRSRTDNRHLPDDNCQVENCFCFSKIVSKS